MTYTRSSVWILLSACFSLWSASTTAAPDEPLQHPFDQPRVWFGAGVGTAQMDSASPFGGGKARGVAANIDGGYLFNPRWGFGGVVAMSDAGGGCRNAGCGARPEDFHPEIDRVAIIGEYRPGDGWRLQMSAGYFLYAYHIYRLPGVDDYDQVLGWGGSASVGYQWHWSAKSRFSTGLRLGAEGAQFPAKASKGLPAYHYRAVTMTLQLAWN